MTRNLPLLLLLLLPLPVFLIAVSAGANAGGPPNILFICRFPDPEEGRKRFPNFDKDGDGFLSREEFIFPNR